MTARAGGAFRWLALRRSLARQLGLIFVLLGLLLAAAWADVVGYLFVTLRDVGRFLEENREVRLAQTLLTSSGELSLLSHLPPPGALSDVGTIDGLMDDLFDTAALTLHKMRTGAPSTDPSRADHEEQEDQLYGDAAAQITRGRELLAAGIGGESEGGAADGRRAELAAVIARLNEIGTRLEEESVEEAFLTSQDLDRRTRNLLWLLPLSLLLLLAVLAGLYAYVHHRLLKPVLHLREDTALFGAGRLDHRVQVAAEDEIGELAREFNRMAARVEKSHTDLEERIAERTRQFVQAAKLAGLGTLAAGVAHEVNTPLASIATAAEGLVRRLRAGEATRDEEVDYLETIAHEAYRARDITTRLLAFARREPGPRTRLRPETPVREVERILHHTMASRGVRLAVDLGPELPAIEANGPEIQQVLLNLLSNGLDVSPPGSRLYLAARRQPVTPDGGGEALVIEIRDEGPGILPEHLPHVFDPFFTTKKPGQGTGLGLSLAYRIVEVHGGTIEVENLPGGGACFRVVLPAAAEADRGAA